MKAHGSIVVEQDRTTGASFLRSGRADPPFSVRWCDDRVLVAASAAAPLGGDDLALDIEVGADAHAHVGTVASTIVLPGATRRRSSAVTRCRVAEGGHLEWAGEPTVSVTGSTHEVTTFASLAATASCVIVEELALGRTDEPSGDIALSIRVERGGEPLVHHTERFGPDVPGGGSTVSVGAARHVLSSVHVGAPAGEPQVIELDGARAARLPIRDDVAVVFALGADRPSVRSLFARVAPATRVRHRNPTPSTN